ncbi:MAG: hypothetical protein IT235_08760 [Bacteroidia bacterium]|nr:hypothetical protein [Bacteroidia bacterium]
MKTPSDDLHLIIHSLTAREKAYISHKLRINGGDAYNLKLFKMVNRQREFDEEKLSGKFKLVIGKKKFIDTKNRLRYTILNLLEGYHSDANANFKLQSYLRQAELLQNKGLYKVASQLLHKAKNLAVEQEKFEYLMLINRMIVFGYRMSRDLEKLEDHIQNKEYKMQDEIIDNIRNEEEYRRLMIRTELLLSKGHLRVREKSDKKNLKDLRLSSFLVDPVNAKTILGKLYYYYILASIATLQGKNKEALNIKIKWFTYLKRNLSGWEVFNKEYLTTLNNISASETSSGRIETFTHAKDFISSLPSKKRTELERIQIHHLSNIITRIPPKVAIGLFKENSLVIEHSIDDNTMILFYINMSIVYFQTNDFHNAIRLLNKIINYKGKERKNDIQLLARIYCAIGHYELGNFDLLPSLLKSYRKWIIKNNDRLVVEVDIISMFMKIPIGHVIKEEKVRFFTEMRELLNNRTKQKGSVISADSLFNCWIESKIHNRPFAEVLREKVKNS